MNTTIHQPRQFPTIANQFTLFAQNAVSRHPLRWIKVTPPALALFERLGSPSPGTVIDGTS
ncbi:hypothetical protein [Pseudomonas brassicacearum]|uniref:hypothetical protein n=1 Tax=Pseudomonas brassicacearum TaxID=930166 RepID=UPI0011CDE051|nr:hypothetical protein [Pseudomonas brassicacearum]